MTDLLATAEIAVTTVTFLELPWAHSRTREVPLPPRTIHINPAMVTSVAPGTDNPGTCFVGLAGGRGYLIGLTIAEALARIGGAS